MTNLLTRRLALFRIASVAGASAVATAPVALAAVQPKTPENPELLASEAPKITMRPRNQPWTDAEQRRCWGRPSPEDAPAGHRAASPVRRFNAG
jgi:hypothetical protein